VPTPNPTITTPLSFNFFASAMAFCFTFQTPWGSPSVSNMMTSSKRFRWFDGLLSLNI
jgi:hypothetical protein